MRNSEATRTAAKARACLEACSGSGALVAGVLHGAQAVDQLPAASACAREKDVSERGCRHFSRCPLRRGRGAKARGRGAPASARQRRSDSEWLSRSSAATACAPRGCNGAVEASAQCEQRLPPLSACSSPAAPPQARQPRAHGPGNQPPRARAQTVPLAWRALQARIAISCRNRTVSSPAPFSAVVSALTPPMSRSDSRSEPLSAASSPSAAAAATDASQAAPPESSAHSRGPAPAAQIASRRCCDPAAQCHSAAAAAAAEASPGGPPASATRGASAPPVTACCAASGDAAASTAMARAAARADTLRALLVASMTASAGTTPAVINASRSTGRPARAATSAAAALAAPLSGPRRADRSAAMSAGASSASAMLREDGSEAPLCATG